jgi:hypothetical protein
MDETQDGKPGRRRSPAQIAALLAEYRESGLTQRAYAARAGVSLSSLVRWLHRRDATAEAPAGFAAVQLRPEASGGSGVTIRWAEGVEVELPLSLGEATLRRWLGRFLAPCSR